MHGLNLEFIGRKPYALGLHHITAIIMITYEYNFYTKVLGLKAESKRRVNLQ